MVFYEIMLDNYVMTLGLGLIGIGRPWGHVGGVVPEEKNVLKFLEDAYGLGIRYFDTAPAYGTSEERLGRFLITLSEEQRNGVTVATKIGEYWVAQEQNTSVDHTYDSMKKSLDQSFKLLKKIDILYLHKATLQSLQSPDVAKIFSYAKQCGIKRFGASVSDVDSAAYVCNSRLYSIIQFPFNQENKLFADSIKLAKKQNKTIVINRPFNMGSTLYKNKTSNPFLKKVKAYKFIMKNHFNGVILTGTKSFDHLQENYRAFQTAEIILS
jgi:aryl-alcohol dehydrogenase-like predicted oxidoreductase